MTRSIAVHAAAIPSPVNATCHQRRTLASHATGGLERGATGCLRIKVRLVDDHQVRDFHDAALHRLQLVSAMRLQQQHQQVDDARDSQLRLADADGFHDDDVIAGGFAQQQRVARAVSDSTQDPG